MKAINFLY